MEKRKIQWDKSMESRFVGFVAGMILFAPKKWKEKRGHSLGIMTAIARAN
jgi:hypothetical protein